MSTSGKNIPRREPSLAAHSRTGFSEISDLDGILERYATARRRAVVMSDYALSTAKNKKLSDSLRYCGSFLTFRHYYTVEQLRLHSAKFCRKHLLCPLCSIRRASKSLQSFIPKLESVLASDPTLTPYLVTLTVKNGPCLADRFRHIVRSISRMTQARRNSHKPRHPYVEMAKADGGLYSIEFKRGKNSGEWHPHVHMVWLCRVPPDARKLSDEWHKFTGDSFIVDARPFDTRKPMATNLMEVLKYALKFSEMSLDDNWEAFEALTGRRLFAAFGSLYGLKLPDELNDDLSDMEGLPYIDLLYRYLPMAGQYTLHATEYPEGESVEQWIDVNLKNRPMPTRSR